MVQMVPRVLMAMDSGTVVQAHMRKVRQEILEKQEAMVEIPLLVSMAQLS